MCRGGKAIGSGWGMFGSGSGDVRAGAQGDKAVRAQYQHVSRISPRLPVGPDQVELKCLAADITQHRDQRM